MLADGMELDVIAACFIGGASASGRYRDRHRRSGWSFHDRRVEQWHVYCWTWDRWQKVVKGVVLLVAVLFDVYNKNKSN